MASEPLAHDVGGRPIFVGSTVRLTNDVAHLYDDGKSREWTVERTLEPGESYKKPESIEPEAQLRWFNSNRTLCIRNKDGVGAFAPALWVTTAGTTASPRERDELRELAMVFFANRNSSMRDIMIALLAWGTDYVHRTNPHAERHDVEEIPITVPFLTILAQKFGHANIGCLATTESVAAAVDVALGQIATLQKRLDTQADFYGRIEAEHAELKRRVDEARKAFGG